MSQPNIPVDPRPAPPAPTSPATEAPAPTDSPAQALVLRLVWSLLRDLRDTSPSPALDALRALYDTQRHIHLLARIDPPADFPTSGGGSSGGCSICRPDIGAGTIFMVLDPKEEHTVIGLTFFVIDGRGARHAFESPEDAIQELVAKGEVTWVLPASAAEMATPLGRSWVRFVFADGPTLNEEVNLAEVG